MRSSRCCSAAVSCATRSSSACECGDATSLQVLFSHKLVPTSSGFLPQGSKALANVDGAEMSAALPMLQGERTSLSRLKTAAHHLVASLDV